MDRQTPLDLYLERHIPHCPNSHSGSLVLHWNRNVYLARLEGSWYILVNLCFWILGGAFPLGHKVY